MRAVRVGVVGGSLMVFGALVAGWTAAVLYLFQLQPPAWASSFSPYGCLGYLVAALVLTAGGTRWPWSAGR